MEIYPLHFFTVKRFINSIKILGSYHISRITKKAVVWGKPLSFSIEPTNHCNLKCPECPSGLGELTRPLGLLKYNSFKEIIDQIKDECFYIQLFFQGEPFINKDLPQMLNYARSNKIYTSISTNGLLLNENRINEILDSPPDKIIFSIDGIDEETYQNYRIGGKFADADNALRKFIIQRNKRGQKKPFVEFQYIVMKQNEHLLKNVKLYSRNAGVDKLVFKTMQVSNYENAIHFLPLNPKYSRYIIDNGTFRIKNKISNTCFALWRTSVVTWDGKIVPCCFDKDADFELGDLNKQKFDDIWNSKKYDNFRNAVLKNRKSIPMCTNCTEGMKINIIEN